MTVNVTKTESIFIRQPDDWHIHLRDEHALALTVNDAARQFERVLVMPNLTPPVTNAELAQAYRQRIMSALDDELSFDPKMTLYLTDQTTADMVQAAADDPDIVAFKWYPAGATTNSESGVTDAKKIYPALEAMQKLGVILCVHGEVTDSDIDIFDREATFIERTLSRIVSDFPSLKIVFEHITTTEAVDFVFAANDCVAATITAHHLLFNRNHMLAGGIRPHYYCLPILKRDRHQHALQRAATSGSPKFFLGTDSAPHLRTDKESSCGCAGSYTAHAAIELYAELFEQLGALDKLEAFSSEYGSVFYGLPLNEKVRELRREPWLVPATINMANGELVPIAAGEKLLWKLV